MKPSPVRHFLRPCALCSFHHDSIQLLACCEWLKSSISSRDEIIIMIIRIIMFNCTTKKMRSCIACKAEQKGPYTSVPASPPSRRWRGHRNYLKRPAFNETATLLTGANEVRQEVSPASSAASTSSSRSKLLKSSSCLEEQMLSVVAVVMLWLTLSCCAVLSCKALDADCAGRTWRWRKIMRSEQVSWLFTFWSALNAQNITDSSHRRRNISGSLKQTSGWSTFCTVSEKKLLLEQPCVPW